MIIIPIRISDCAYLLKGLDKIEAIKGSQLSLIEKILLVETGSIEKMLSIMVNSEVNIKVVYQAECGNMIKREIIMDLKCNSNHMLYAKSIIYTNTLPSILVEKIKEKKSGIGKIISQLHLETFRQITHLGYESGNPSRFYNILYKGDLSIRIKETFLINNIIKRATTFNRYH